MTFLSNIHSYPANTGRTVTLCPRPKNGPIGRQKEADSQVVTLFPCQVTVQSDPPGNIDHIIAMTKANAYTVFCVNTRTFYWQFI